RGAARFAGGGGRRGAARAGRSPRCRAGREGTVRGRTAGLGGPDAWGRSGGGGGGDVVASVVASAVTGAATGGVLGGGGRAGVAGAVEEGPERVDQRWGGVEDEVEAGRAEELDAAAAAFGDEEGVGFGRAFAAGLDDGVVEAPGPGALF